MFRALETNRDYCSDELGKHRHVNVPPSYFVRNFGESGRLGLKLTPHFYRLKWYRGRATTFSSSDPVQTRISAPAGSSVFHEITQLPEADGIRVCSYVPSNLLGSFRVSHC